MPFKDEDKRRSYNREYQRKRRAEARAVTPLTESLTPTLRLETADDLRRVLELITSEMLNANIDIGVKGRVIAQLLTVGVRIIEVTGLESRIEKLEAALTTEEARSLN